MGKHVILLLFCTLAAIAFFHSCDEGSLDNIDSQSFILVKDDPEKPIPVLEGQTMEMKIGEMVLPAFLHPGKLISA